MTNPVRKRTFVESKDGIHLMRGEFTLCGEAFDIAAVDPEHGGFSVTRTSMVTCPKCIDIIDDCRNCSTYRSRTRCP